MKDNYREFYQLIGERYLSDGMYIWEDVDGECGTLEECLDLMVHAQGEPEYTDLKIEFRRVTIIRPSENEGDN